MIARCDEIVELLKVFAASCLVHEIAAPAVGRGVSDAIEQVEAFCGSECLWGGIGIRESERRWIDRYAIRPPNIARAILEGRITVATILDHVKATGGNRPLCKVDVDIGCPSAHQSGPLV